jgi:trigger factor
MTDKSVNLNINSTLAKSEDGSIQITFDIPYSFIVKAKEEALVELAKTTEVPGFRKGNAPVSEVKKRVEEADLIEKALTGILPKYFGDAIEKFKIKPVVYPKFELIKALENENWQIIAKTCEIPTFELPDYKKIIAGKFKEKQIWTPEKGSPNQKEEKKEESPEEKEQTVVSLLLANTKFEIPKILVEEEVNSRLSSLLERTEKLGLTLEGYLASINKKPEDLRKEYEEKAINNIKVDLILEKIATDEKITAEEKEIDALIQASSADPKVAEKLNTPEQRRFIASILRKRKTLENLTKLA